MDGFESPKASSTQSSDINVVLGLIGGFAVLGLIIWCALKYKDKRAQHTTITPPVHVGPIRRSETHLPAAVPIMGVSHALSLAPAPEERYRVLDGTALLNLQTGEYYGDGRPMTRVVDHNDLANFHPAGGMYARVPMDIQHQLHLEANGHIVVPVHPVVHVPANMIVRGDEGLYSGLSRQRRARDILESGRNPIIGVRPIEHEGVDVDSSSARVQPNYHRTNESVDTLPRYPTPAPDYKSENNEIETRRDSV